MGKQQQQQKTPDNTISRGEYRKVISNLAEAITSLKTISESLDKTATQQAQKEKRQHKFQTFISVISFLFAVASACVSTYIAMTQFSKSGPQFSYVAQVSDTNGWTEQYNDTVIKHRKGNSTSILLSNTGRMKTTVLSVSVEDSKKKHYDNRCRHQEVTIEPGETKLIIARFSDLRQPIAKVHVLTGDAQTIEAKEQDPPESDVAVQEAIDYAIHQWTGSKSSEQPDKDSDENTPIDPDNDVVCSVDPDDNGRE